MRVPHTYNVTRGLWLPSIVANTRAPLNSSELMCIYEGQDILVDKSETLLMGTLGQKRVEAGLSHMSKYLPLGGLSFFLVRLIITINVFKCFSKIRWQEAIL